jgi:hypothetical protein
MPMAPRLGRLATAAMLQLAALVLGHQLVYLARYGSRFGEALVHSGHGDAWTWAVISSLVLVAGFAALAVARLVRLGVLVRRAGTGTSAPAPRGDLAPMGLLRTWLRLAPRIAVLQLVLLTAQENIERSAIGEPMPGPGVLLSPEYAGGAWIALGVALLVSLVAALFAWRRGVLLARLRATRAPLPRAAVSELRPVQRESSPVESLLGRRSALRAPPPAPIAS